MSAATRRRLPPRVRLPRISARGCAVLLALVAVLVGAFFWVRQSSLVAVRRVTITGVSGPDAGQIRTALAGAAHGMSTLDIDARRLHAAVSPYPVVRALRLHADIPHGLRITVVEQIPVAVILAGGDRILTAADGTLLRGDHASSALPTIASSIVPGGSRVTGATREEVALLASAPYPLLAKLASAGDAFGARGLEATLRNGPTIYFGADSALAAKWRAAVAVVANPTSESASYIDVTDPARPAAGAGSDADGASTTHASPSSAG